MKLTRYDKPMNDDSPRQEERRGRPVNPESYHSLGKKYGINYGTLRNRLQAGMTLEEAVSKPVQSRRKGRPKDPDGLPALARKHGIKYATLMNRVRKGMTLEEALKKPVRRYQGGES